MGSKDLFWVCLQKVFPKFKIAKLFMELVISAIKYPKNHLQWYFVTKIVLPTVRKKCSSDREKLLKFEAEGQEFAKILRSLNKTIYSNSERSEQFLVTECFFNLFLEVS